MDSLFDEKVTGVTVAEKKNEELNIKSDEVQLTFQTVIEKTRDNLPLIIRKVTGASMDLSKITAIDSDEMDEIAEKVLVKARTAFEQVQAMRKEITDPLDGIKDKLMPAEKRISNNANSPNSEWIRVKKLRDDYAQKKFLKKQEDDRKALAEQNKKEEIARLKSYFEILFHDKVLDAVNALDNTISKFLSSIKLEEWDSKIKMLDAKPNLKKELFESWFIVGYDKAKLTEAEFNSFVEKVKTVFTYDVINGAYQESAEPKVAEWKLKVPERKKELEDIAELEKTNKAEADKKAAELLKKSEDEQAERNAQVEAEKQQHNEVVKEKENSEVLNAQFNTLRVTQDAPNLKGTTTKNVCVFTGPDNKIIEVVAKVLFQNFQNPKFTIRKEKKTQDEPDTYADWLQEILDFFAKNGDHEHVKIEGIEIKQAVSTSARSVKKK